MSSISRRLCSSCVAKDDDHDHGHQVVKDHQQVVIDGQNRQSVAVSNEMRQLFANGAKKGTDLALTSVVQTTQPTGINFKELDENGDYKQNTTKDDAVKA